MQLVTVSKDFFETCKNYGTDKEILHDKEGRPCVLLVNLIYRGVKRTFVVPLRSNIAANTPKNQYFALPPNATTQSGNRHGLHYAKIFPITAQYIQPYNISRSNYLLMIKNILDKNERKIVKECQDYLRRYEEGMGSWVTPDIDGILEWL